MSQNSIQTEAGVSLPIKQTIGYFAVFIGLGMTAASLGPTLTGLAAHTNSAISQISFLFTARGFGYLLGSLRGGRTFDRLPGHPLILTMMLAMGGMMALAPLTDRLWILALLLFLLGLAEGTVDVGGNTLLVWVHQQRVGPYMNALHFFFGIGAFLAPIIAAQALMRTNDINWVYWLVAIYFCLVVVWFINLPSPKAPRAVVHQQNRVMYPGLVGLMVLFFILYVGAEAGFGGWVFTYAITLNLASPATAAYLTSIFWGAFTLGRLGGIPLATRFQPQGMLVWDLAGCLISMLIILAFPKSLAALGVGAAGLGLSQASIFPSMLVYAGRRMPLSGRVTGWFFVGAGAGGMILPWLLGQIFEKIGPEAIMWAILIDLLAMGLVFLAIRLYNRHQPDSRQSSAV